MSRDFIEGCTCTVCIANRAENEKLARQLEVKQQIEAAKREVQRAEAAKVRAKIDVNRGIDPDERGVCDLSMELHPKYTKCKNWKSLRNWVLMNCGVLLPTKKALELAESLGKRAEATGRTLRGMDAIQEQAADQLKYHYNIPPVAVMGFCDNGPLHHEQGSGCKNWRKAVYRTGTLEESKPDFQKNLREYRASMGNPIPKPAPDMCGDDYSFRIDMDPIEQRVVNDAVNKRLDEINSAADGGDPALPYPYPSALARYGWEPVHYKWSYDVAPPLPKLFGKTYVEILQEGRDAAERDFVKDTARVRRDAMIQVINKLYAWDQPATANALRTAFGL